MPDSAEPSDVIERSEKLALLLSERADAVDAGTADCRDSYRLVAEAGLLRMLVPRRHGGDGLTFSQCTRVLEILGTRDAATALGLNMHNVSIGGLCEVGDSVTGATRAFRDLVFREVVERDSMFASATSEAGTGAKLSRLGTTYVPAGDGFVLTGRKSFVSLAGVADHYVVAARAADGAGNEVSHFVVAAQDPGVRFGSLWPGTAMAGTSTAEMVLDGVRVGRDRLYLNVEGMSLFKLAREPHWMVSGYTGVYLGLAAAILTEVKAAIRADEVRRAAPAVQRDVGLLAARLAAARALTYSACDAVDRQRGSRAANAGVHAAKFTVGEVLTELAGAAVRLCGTRALDRTASLARYLRESQFCAVMPAKPAECLEYLGKTELAFDMRDVRSFDW